MGIWNLQDSLGVSSCQRWWERWCRAKCWRMTQSVSKSLTIARDKLGVSMLKHSVGLTYDSKGFHRLCTIMSFNTYTQLRSLGLGGLQPFVLQPFFVVWNCPFVVKQRQAETANSRAVRINCWEPPQAGDVLRPPKVTQRTTSGPGHAHSEHAGMFGGCTSK